MEELGRGEEAPDLSPMEGGSIGWEELEALYLTLWFGGSRVPTGDLTQDDAQVIHVESFSHPLDTTRAGNAAGRPHKRRDSLLDGGGGKRGKSIDVGYGSGPTDGCGVYELQRSGEESWMPSSSGHPAEPARGIVISDYCSGRQIVQHERSLQSDGVKHKIFISHSGRQKGFAEQLCEDLENRGYLRPFFDQRQHSLPKGKDFVPLIKDAARHCHVAVMVLSKEFLWSKWPMIELAAFHGAQQAENPGLNLLPLFYELSVKDLDEEAIEECWMPRWRQLADGDARVDLAKWSGAVRALRKANGHVFGQKGVSEVGYRKDIVQSIFELSAPDLLYGSFRNMVGYSRLCEVVRDQFMRGTSGGPSFLGLYGASGVGKTTLSKALCDEFCRVYMGRVCHVDLGDAPGMDKASYGVLNLRLERVKWMLKKLCGLDKEALASIHDVDEGLTVMCSHMKREPVFLVIDNVTDVNSSWKEACGYLAVGFHPESRIVITSRSKENIRKLVVDIPFCVPMPRLSVMEAGELFLRSAAPSMSVFRVTDEQQRIVGLCIQQCLYYDPDRGELARLTGEDEGGLLSKVKAGGSMRKSFHPMALTALGDFFCRYFSDNDMLEWTEHMKENENPLWDVWNLPNGIGKIFGMQFLSLPSSQQLLFLDIVLFCGGDGNGEHIDEFVFGYLLIVHAKKQKGMYRQLKDLERSGFIKVDWVARHPSITMHEIYRTFAEWYLTNHGVKRLEEAWCVSKSRGSTSNGDNVALSELVRVRMDRVSVASARVLASKTMQELHNLEVLDLSFFSGVKALNLERLIRLRYLRIRYLQDLESVTLRRSDETVDTLECVELEGLDSLVHGPDIRRCTSLVKYAVWNCSSMTNMDGMECPELIHLKLWGLVGHQLASLLKVNALCSLQRLVVFANCSFYLSELEMSRGVCLKDVGKPYLRVVEEVAMYLSNVVGNEWVGNVDSSLGFWIDWYGVWDENQYEEGLTLRDTSGGRYDWGDCNFRYGSIVVGR